MLPYTRQTKLKQQQGRPGLGEDDTQKGPGSPNPRATRTPKDLRAGVCRPGASHKRMSPEERSPSPPGVFLELRCHRSW